MSRTALQALVVVFALLPSACWSATATIGAEKDNSIFQNNPDYSGGGGAGIFAGANGMNSPRRGLIAFDIAEAVPAGAAITGVQLTMYLGNAPDSNPQNIELHKLNKDWGEGNSGSTNPSIMMSGMGYPADIGDATWNEAMFQTSNWTNSGAVGDFNPTASATLSVSGPVDTPFTWTSTPALVADAQSWLDTPATDFGWLLFNTNEVAIRSLKAFYSRNATQDSSNLPNSLVPAWRPSLKVTYTTSAPPTGDYNHNGVVDTADYAVWRKTLNGLASPAGSAADGNQSGTIDGGDYTYWRARFGNPASGFASGSSVPEPASNLLFLFIAPLAFGLRRR